MGLHEDLDEASRLAVRELVEFLVSEKKLSREDAYMLCSLAASLRVTQAVDATKGIPRCWRSRSSRRNEAPMVLPGGIEYLACCGGSGNRGSSIGHSSSFGA